QTRGIRHGKIVYLCSADDETFLLAVLLCEIKRWLNAMHHCTTWCRKIFLTRDNNIRPVGKWFEFWKKRIVIFPSHNDMVSLGGFHEKFHIIREPPWQVVVPPDNTILRKRCNG